MLRLFSKRKQEELDPLSFSVIKTDIHSHLIPGIDDGSADMETTISLIQEMHMLGFSKLIITPHIMSDFYRNSSQTILQGLADVRTELKSRKIDMAIEASAEYYVDYNFEQKIGEEKFLTFTDNYILIELSFAEPPRNLFETIFKLQLEGYKVVLAHPERYNYFQSKDYSDLVDRSVFFQINWLSLIGYYSPKVRDRVEYLISKDMVSFIGTDCHNMSHIELYKRCQTKKAWHDLYSSGKLLNSTL